MLDGRPVYRFHFGRRQSAVYADSGEPVEPLPLDVSRRVAADWAGQAPERARLLGRQMEEDQWTLNKQVRPLRPFAKYAWPDGAEVYVSEVTGEVMQATTRGARLGAWLGAIPHWLYFTPLRKETGVWRATVIGLSLAGVLMTVLGLAIGFWLYSPARRYRFPAGPSSIPFAGPKRWHTILGLGFGFTTFTWILSGLFSMNPWQWSPEAGPNPAHAGQLQGSKWRSDPFEREAPAHFLRRLAKPVRELELFYFQAQPHYRAWLSGKASVVAAPGEAPRARFREDEILRAMWDAGLPVDGGSVRLVTRYENYYVDRLGRKPLPVLYLEVAGTPRTSHYIDLASAAIVASYEPRSRWNRWLYHGLHSWDLPWLYRIRPLWDVLLWVMLAGGFALSGVAAWMAARRVSRPFLRRSSAPESPPGPERRSRPIASAPSCRSIEG
jgi:hypothetical protein